MEHQFLLLCVEVFRLLWLRLHTKYSPFLNAEYRIINNVAAHTQLVISVCEVDLRYSLLLKRHVAVEIQRALSFAIATRSDEDVGTLLSKCRRGLRSRRRIFRSEYYSCRLPSSFRARRAWRCCLRREQRSRTWRRVELLRHRPWIAR